MTAPPPEFDHLHVLRPPALRVQASLGTARATTEGAIRATRGRIAAAREALAPLIDAFLEVEWPPRVVAATREGYHALYLSLPPFPDDVYAPAFAAREVSRALADRGVLGPNRICHRPGQTKVIITHLPEDANSTHFLRDHRERVPVLNDVLFREDALYGKSFAWEETQELLGLPGDFVVSHIRL